mgnify:CR=1 FL=1
MGSEMCIRDSYSAEDIEKVRGPETILVSSSDVVAEYGAGEVLEPGRTKTIDGAKIFGVASYNPAKQFHPKRNNWLGFVLDLGGERIYYAGDTDLIEEMKSLSNIDVALLPVGGTYTMDAAAACEAAEYINPKLAVPYHWGDIVGGEQDARRFEQLANCKVTVLKQGEMMQL